MSIVGWADYSKRIAPMSGVIKAMTRQFENADTEGFWVSEHTLLGSAEPSQPTIAKCGDGMCILVMSGELYNTDDIIRDLEACGHKFETRDDAHAVLHAYMEWGLDFAERLNGVFSLALRDAEKELLILARDRLGVKPLFYHLTRDGLVFSSMLKALLQHPDITPSLGPDGLGEIFAVGPARTPGHGVFRGVRELKPGSLLTFDRDGIKIRKYWSLICAPHEESFEETANSVRELVLDAARRQAGAGAGGGEVAYLLSGGLDSSVLCAIAEGAGPIKTVSVDYRGNDRHFRPSAFQPNPDAPWVRRVAGHLKSDHAVCTLDTPELVSSLFDAVRALGLPGMADIDSSLLLFSRWIRERAAVGITGECADEFFGGYPWFYRSAGAVDDTFPWSRRLADRVKLYSPEFVQLTRPEEYLRARYEDALAEVPKLDGELEADARARKIGYLTMTRWLPTLLRRQEAMSRAAGITLRAPFSDHRIVEYMWNVPWSMKYCHNREKGLLRHAMAGVLPDDVLWRKKSPFPKTHNPDYIDAVRKMTLAMLDDPSSPIMPLLNKSAVREFALNMTTDTELPWFGQLMNAPQLLAYFLQVDFWLREYNVAM